MKYIMCIDGGGTAIKYNIMSTEGKLIHTSKAIATPKSKADFVTMIDGFVQEAVQEISGLAFSMPGYINSQTGYIIGGGAFTYLADTYFFELFEHLNIPISLENDGRAFAVAEHAAGSAQNCDDFICITIGTGIGAGIMVNGQLIHGHRYCGGEYGWSMLTTNIQNEILPHHFTSSMSALIQMYRTVKGLGDNVHVEGYEIFEEAEQNAEVQAIIDTWYTNIATLIFNLAVTFNPEKILIGGGVSARPDLPEKIEQALLSSKVAQLWNVFKAEIATCKYRNDAGFIGAYYHFRSLYPEVE